MKKCYICGKDCLDFDMVIDGMYLNMNGKFDAISMCQSCYHDLDKARMKNDVEFLMSKKKKEKTIGFRNKSLFGVGDKVYFITSTPISSAHPFVYNRQIGKGEIIAISIKIKKDETDCKYLIKHESDKLCRTYSNIFKTKQEAEKEL